MKGFCTEATTLLYWQSCLYFLSTNIPYQLFFILYIAIGNLWSFNQKRLDTICCRILPPNLNILSWAMIHFPHWAFRGPCTDLDAASWSDSSSQLSFLGVCSCCLAPWGADTHRPWSFDPPSSVRSPKIDLRPRSIMAKKSGCLPSRYGGSLWSFTQMTNTSKLFVVVLGEPLRDFSVSHHSLLNWLTFFSPSVIIWRGGFEIWLTTVIRNYRRQMQGRRRVNAGI